MWAFWVFRLDVHAIQRTSFWRREGSAKLWPSILVKPGRVRFQLYTRRQKNGRLLYDMEGKSGKF